MQFNSLQLASERPIRPAFLQTDGSVFEQSVALLGNLDELLGMVEAIL